MPASRLYVFCFARPSALAGFAAAGFDPGRPVEVLPLGSFAAVATSAAPGGITDLLDPVYQERRLRELDLRTDVLAAELKRDLGPLVQRYTEVVKAVWKRSPVMPMPVFKSIFSSPEHVKTWSAGKRSKWIELRLMENAEKDEWRVRGVGEHPSAPSRVQDVRRQVYPYTNERDVELKRHDGEWMHEAWYVWRRHQEKWQQGVAEEAERLKEFGLSLEITGPHPPFNFLPDFASQID